MTLNPHRHTPYPQTGPCELCNAKRTTNWRRIPTSVPGFDGQLQTGCKCPLVASSPRWHAALPSPQSLVIRCPRPRAPQRSVFEQRLTVPLSCPRLPVQATRATCG